MTFFAEIILKKSDGVTKINPATEEQQLAGQTINLAGNTIATDIFNQLDRKHSEMLFEDFGAANNIGLTVGAALIFDNDNGYSSIAFRVTPPTGGTVAFEVSPDGDNWDSAAMRSTLNDEYLSSVGTIDFIIGSISAMRKFRVRTTDAGSAEGTIKGRAQRDASTTEGSEFSNRPDKIGAELITKSGQFSTAVTGFTLWTPGNGKRFFVTGYKINAFGATDGEIKVFDETDAEANWISPPTFYDVAVNGAIIDSEMLMPPYPSKAIGNSVKVTSSSGIDFNITIRGYEAQ